MSQPGHQRVQIEFHGRPLTVETGRMARQAGGAALVQFGESVVLVTATALTTAREGIDFFPLTCDYQEKTFAAGKIPGGFFKREGRPAEKEILTSRLIDRPLRPLFPKGFNCETQVIATVLSHDKENDPDVLSLLGASTALVLSDIPWSGPIAAVRIGRLDGRFVIHPTTSQLATSDMNVIVAGSRDAIVMVEGGARMVPEALLLEALFAAHEALQPLIALQESLQRLVGKPKRSVTAPAVDPALERQVREAALPSLRAALAKPGKQERYDALDQARDQVVARLGEGTPERLKQVAAFFDHLKKDVVREAIVQQKRRLDGRGLADVRPITCEVEVLPRTHGSALFTRGETQALVVATLGTSSDEQKIDALIGQTYKKFMLHYNFPPFSTGEVKVAGTETGITAVQMDIKLAGVTRAIMEQALEDARRARLHILGVMNQTLARPRGELSTHAPRIVTIHIKPDRIRDLIGPGGKVIRGITEETGVKIDVEDDGTVLVASSDGAAMQKALDKIRGVTAEAEVGKIYRGTA